MYNCNMALVGYLEVPPELQALLKNLISSTSNRRTGAVRKAGYLPSRKRVNQLTQRSLLPQIRDFWDGLTEPERTAWKVAAKTTNMNGWNLFVQDTAYRLKYGIAGLAAPSNLHQYKVGRVEIAAPAQRVVLRQYHPEKYYISKKVRGDTTLRENVAIHERLRLPLVLAMSYRAQLVPTAPDARARFYATIYSSYQGRTIETERGFDFDLTTGWQRDATSITEVIGVARSYDLWIELHNVRGWLEFDNVVSEHTGSNYARDFRCNDVNNELTMANFQIEASWEEQFLPNGTAFDSVYPADS